MNRHLALAAALVASALVGAAGPIEATNSDSSADRDETPWTLPTRPDRCTTDEADSGDVGHCLLAFYTDPADTGWGQPPAPGVGTGWNWLGHTYSGSPALADWETTQITANAETVATLEPGALETHAAANALFEGFLRDIHDGGYAVNGASGYSFRCTSGNGGWDCPSGNPDDLSNHAYGLAIDMNAGTNPIRRYDAQNGVTACQTPMQTDMPHWVIQTAERWGLYWGGYGWNRGCADPTTERTSVYRDPPHFEFRGTPEQAAAIAAFNNESDPRRRCFITLDDDGTDVEHCNFSGTPEAGWRLPVTVDAPEGATAVMINLTATEPSGHGFFTLEHCGPVTTERSTSALTFAPGDTVATMAVIPLDEAGRFCVYHSTAVHSIVDVVGYLVAGEAHDAPDDPSGAETNSVDHDPRLWLQTSQATRLTDTRSDGSCAPFQECTDGPVAAGAVHAVPTDDAPARLANVAVIGSGDPGFLQAGGCADVGPDRTFSNLNYIDRSVRSNLALIAGDEQGSCVYALSDAHVIVDELGTLTSDAGYGWALQEPSRQLDTRECGPAWCDDRPADGAVIELDLGLDAPAAAVGITVTQPSRPGFIWAGRCDELVPGEPPATSNVNYMAGQTVTNMAIVGLDEGTVCLYVYTSAHVIVDVQASLTEERTIGLAATEPTRAHDSRELGASTN